VSRRRQARSLYSFSGSRRKQLHITPSLFQNTLQSQGKNAVSHPHEYSRPPVMAEGKIEPASVTADGAFNLSAKRILHSKHCDLKRPIALAGSIRWFKSHPTRKCNPSDRMIRCSSYRRVKQSRLSLLY